MSEYVSGDEHAEVASSSGLSICTIVYHLQIIVYQLKGKKREKNKNTSEKLTNNFLYQAHLITGVLDICVRKKWTFQMFPKLDVETFFLQHE